MIVEAFSIVADAFSHLFDWWSSISFGGVSVWSIFLGAFAIGLLFKVLHSMFFKEES